jgi:hypothetical protein
VSLVNVRFPKGRIVLGLLDQLYEASDFIRRIRIRARFGKFSRAPLEPLRLVVHGAFAECSWLSRAADEWDQDLPRPMRERNATTQALADALSVRVFLFSALPAVASAHFRVYRQNDGGQRDLIIAGTVTRGDPNHAGVQSLAMKVKLCGLQFRLNDGALLSLQSEEHEVEFLQKSTPSLG